MIYLVNNLDSSGIPKKRSRKELFAKGSLIAVIISIPSLATFFLAWFLLQNLIEAAIMIYWVRVLKKMTKENQPQYVPKESDSKNWVYDLMKGEQEIVFVAEVLGPEDQVSVRLIDGILYIRGSGKFSKEIAVESTPDMGIHDFKYRNGVLTLRIKKL